MSVRARFEAARGFPLDAFQRDALDALDAGRSVLVAAPTGSGKTLVAEYAIELALESGAKAFYTTPLKALSNQKYGDLVRAHGAARVGLLTGDNAINGDAPVVVMTTEVLRNMIYAGSPLVAGLRYVVLDEVHYLQDPYRGAVWEEVIVHLEPDVDLVALSATVSNAEEVAAWLEAVRGATTAVIEERRPVRLLHRYLVGERGHDTLHLLPTFVGDDDDLRPNPEAARLDRRGGGAGARGRARLRTPGRAETLDLLAEQELLPAITFVFSRAGCDRAVEHALEAGVRLTTPDERQAIRAIADDHTASLGTDDLEVLGYPTWLAGLEAGLAAHHAGMVPPMKEAVEEAFASGLVKMVYATETLALGVNMPARSVVIEKLSKFTGERHELLTPGEYTQLTGRAGRRGIDDVGYAVVCWSPFVPFEQVAGLASRRTDALRSSFRPTYNMGVNLVRRHSREVAHHLLNLSFAQFHADRDVVALERQLERTRALLERERERATSPYGDVAGYRRLAVALEAEHRERGTDRAIADALGALRPGDVLVVGRRGGRCVVLGHDRRRSGPPRLLALSTSRDLVRLGTDDFDGPPEAVARIELPEPYAPRSPVFRRTTLERLRRATLRDRAEPTGPRRSSEKAAALAAHPVAADPERDQRLRAAAAVERLQREATRLERRVRRRGDSLARQLDRVLALLESWGYVEDWALRPPGEVLARLYSEADLLVAESLRDGLLDGLTPPELAAVVSCFTYQRRGPEGEPEPPDRWATRLVAERSRRIDAQWRELANAESDARLPETRRPDPGLTPFVYDWARGQSLADVLGDDELTGGDFVRNVKQLIDLLRQLGDVVPVAATRDAARAAADACQRGVVVAAGVSAS